MTTVLNPYPKCKKDGFPMVEIGNRQQCVAEYLDCHIGGEKIVDIVQEDETGYYIFENGYKLPILCFCCAKPLKIQNLKELRRVMLGRKLESMSVGEVDAPDGNKFLEFQLEFSQKKSETEPILQSLAPEAAIRMKKLKREQLVEPFVSKKRSRPQSKRGFG